MERPPPPQYLQVRRRQVLVWPAAWALAAAGRAWANDGPGIEVLGLRMLRTDAGLQLDFWPRIRVSRTVQDALERGVPPQELAKILPKDKIIYCYCLAGGRCAEAAAMLRLLGYDVRAIKPGYPQLVKAGFPAVVGK